MLFSKSTSIRKNILKALIVYYLNVIRENIFPQWHKKIFKIFFPEYLFLVE